MNCYKTFSCFFKISLRKPQSKTTACAVVNRKSKIVNLLTFSIIFLCFSSCGDKQPELELPHEIEPTLTATNPLLKLITPQESGIDFQNIITETDEDNFTTNVNKYNGGGLAIADVNNDGLQDIYFICTNGKNRLYLNTGGFKFKDITDAAGLASADGFETAVTAVDINADGWMDFYICRAGTVGGDIRRNKLFINNGSKTPLADGRGTGVTFTEQAKIYGLDFDGASTGANFFDADNDGDLDLYLLNYPISDSYSNKIESIPTPSGNRLPVVDPPQPIDSDKFYRNDGPPRPPKGGGSPLQGSGGGGFTDISQKSGIWNFGYGLSVSVSDFNCDGWPDVYVGNDYHVNDFFYQNNKNGTFTERIREITKHTSRHTMGTDATDFDNDGLVDLLGVDMLPHDNRHLKTSGVTQLLAMHSITVQSGYHFPVVRNVLQHNNGNGTFSDVGCQAGIFKTDWSWSGLFFDMDNDGRKDLHVTNGYRREINDKDFFEFKVHELESRMKGKTPKEYFASIHDFLDMIPSLKTTNYCYQNDGDFKFSDRSGDWMTMPATWSCGAAWADFDNDGDLDLVVNNLEEPAFLYQNQTVEQKKGNFLQLKLQGSPKNPQAVGASALILVGGQTIFQELNPVRGIFSSVENLLHFGIGTAQKIDKLTVRWPDGKTQTLTEVPANQRLTLKYSDAAGYVAHLAPPKMEHNYFTEISPTAAGIDWQHEENRFNDFETWQLNPWKTTDLGPLVAAGDVNGDGLDDFFVGNSFDKPGAIFVQSSLASGERKFARSNQNLMLQEKLYEDHDAVFFDADGDGDADLFVVSGGMEATTPLAWVSRLYLNDGKGNFSKLQNAIPQSSEVGLRATAHDFDGDGDLDLVVGGRVTPAKWPLTPRSLFWQNDGKARFSDVTAQIAPDFEKIGMVTAVEFVNLDSDPAAELVAVGEFMPISIFKFSGGKWVNSTANFGLEKSNGLWNSLAAADLDGDGDMDLVTGNLGLNTRFSVSEELPLRVYAKDFDENGQLDPIVAYPSEGKLWPLPQKDLLNKNIPKLKKKFLYARAYGAATVEQVFPQRDLDAALNLRANLLETCWWENQNGKFVKKSLPAAAQTSPANGILISDFTGDGLLDILLAGNKYGMEVETNACDAGNGSLLKGDGKGNFTFINNLFSGFWAQNEVRDLALLRSSGGKKIVVVANNSSKPQMFLGF